MPPQGIELKALRKHQDRIKWTKALSCFAIVLIGTLGTAVTVALAQYSPEMSGWLSITEAIEDGDTLHQSDPDCKYPPCD